MEKQSCVYFHHLKPSLSQTKSQHTRSVDLILLTRLRTLQPQFRPLAAPPVAALNAGLQSPPKRRPAHQAQGDAPLLQVQGVMASW